MKKIMIIMTKASILIMFLMVLSACNKEEGLTINKTFGDCLIDQEPIESFIQPECTIIGSQDSICKVVVVDSTFQLDQEAFDWLPYFCGNAGDHIVFHNAKGNQTVFSIFSKTYRFDKQFRYLTDGCPLENSKWIAYCLTSELAQVELRNSNLNIDFSVFLKRDYEIGENDLIFSGTSISIQNIINFNGGIGLSTHFYAPINHEQLNNNWLTSGHELRGEMAILDRTFQNVNSYSGFLNNGDLNIFYTKKDGIVSFTDSDGVLWVLNK